jgi:hypothetical protein
MLSPQAYPALAFFLFHLRVGARLAAKGLAPVIAFFFASFYLFRIEFFIELARALFLDSHVFISGLAFTAVTVMAARFISPRVCLGLNGWIRHLPLRSRTHRRLAAFSVFIALMPMLIVLSLPSLLLAFNLGLDPAVFLIGLPFLGVSSAIFVLPVRHGLMVKFAALISCFCAASGSWFLLASSVPLILLSDGISGPLRASQKHSRFGRILRGLWLSYSISWRALRLRIFYPFLLAFIPLGLTWVFLVNNEPGPPLSEKVILAGGAAGLALFFALLANLLAVRRPPWPWIRSFPWSSLSRVLIDSGFLIVHAAPLVLLISFWENRTAAPLILSLPALAFLSCLSIRQAPDSRTGAYGKILTFGIPGALGLGIIPWVAVFYLALSPLLLKQARDSERSQKVSLWLERHHLAAGDPLSWSRE